VYLAEDVTGRQLALKELIFALVPSIKQLEAFDREAGFLMQLSHSQIPRFLESFRVGEGVQTRLYLAQEFVTGVSLLDNQKTHRSPRWYHCTR
jgi:serine/threonine protein kinase